MGFYYDSGHGVEQDPREAARWYKRAAGQLQDGTWAEGSVWSEEKGEAGHFGERKDALIAQWRLAKFYYEGKGVQKNIKLAFLMINNVSKLSLGEDIYFCCANMTIPLLPGEGGRSAKPVEERRQTGRWVTTRMIERTRAEIEGAMPPDELEKARKAFETWSSKSEQ
jgi:hypothetical protein